MALFQIGTDTRGDFTYTLYEVAASAPASLTTRVLDFLQRKGASSFSFTRYLQPHDVVVDFFDKTSAIFDRVAIAGKQQFLLVIEESSQEIFRGWYVPEVDEESLYIMDNRLRLRFTSGLQLLKDYSWDQTGEMTFNLLLRTLFYKIGYELPIFVNVDFYEENVTTGRFVDNHRTALFGFLQRNPDATYYDVLDHLMAWMKAWCWQEDGYWYVFQYSNREDNVPESIQTNGTSGTSVLSFTKTITTFLKPLKRKILRGFKKIDRTILGISDPSSIQNTVFDDWNDDDSAPIDWMVESGSVTKADSGTNDGEVMQLNANTMTVFHPLYRMTSGRGSFEISINIEIELENNTGTQTVPVLEVILHNNNPVGGAFDKRWVDEDGNLSSTQDYIQLAVVVPGSNPTATINQTINCSVDYPNAALIWAEVRVVATNEFDVDTSAGWYVRAFKVEAGGDMKFGGEVPEQYQSSSEVAGNDDGLIETEITALGDDRTIKPVSDLSYYNGSAWNEGESFTSVQHSPTTKDINTIIIDNYLRKVGTRLTQIKQHVKHSENPKFFQVITMNHFGSDVKYLPYYIERSARVRKQKMYVIEYPADQTLN
jgi:hypothetical protein